MSTNYIRSTRPIGRHQQPPKKQPPNINTTPHITRLLFSLLSHTLHKTLASSFHNIKTSRTINESHKSNQQLALLKLSHITPRVEERLKYQSLFLIRNFVPKETRSNFDEINWHRDGNEKELVDPKSEILRGIVYCPFKKARREEKEGEKKKEIVLVELSLHSLISTLSPIFLKPKLRGFSSLKSRALLLNKPFRSALSLLLNLSHHSLTTAFSRIKYKSNRLYLKPRTQQHHKYRSLSLLKSQMQIQAQRRQIIKQSIDRQKSYRNQIIITRQRRLRSQVLDYEQQYENECDRLRNAIMQQEIYIENIFGADLRDTSVEAFDYFDILKGMYLDLTGDERVVVQKRNFVKKYQVEEYDDGNEVAVMENVRLWERVRGLEEVLGIGGRKGEWGVGVEEGMRVKQKGLMEENAGMKRVIGFYVKEEYGRNLTKEMRLIGNLKRELEEMEEKLGEDRIEDVKVMFS